MPEEKIEITIRSNEVQEILTKVPHWLIRYGNTLLLVLIFIVVLISWLVKYPDIISNQVILTTQNPPEKVFAKATGKFEAILVNDREMVRKGQALAVLKNTALYPDILLLKNILDSLPADRNHFSFALDQLPPLILGDLNNSYAVFENHYREYQSNRKYNRYENEKIVNGFALSEAKTQLKALMASLDLDKQKLELKRSDIARQKELFDKKLISLEEYERQRINHLQAEQSHLDLQTTVSQKRESIHNLEQRIENGEIASSQDGIKLLRQALQSYYELKKRLEDWENQYLLRSSVSGQVSSLKVWNKNQQVNAGDLVYTIIPADNNNYIGKIVAPPKNLGKIKAGQKVQIKLAKLPADEYGELNGKVASISLVPNAEGNYIIDVRLPKELKTTYDIDIEFSPEMQGMADIVTEDLRLIERFFYQLKGIFE